MTPADIVTSILAQHANAWYVAGTDTQRGRVVAAAALVLEPMLREWARVNAEATR